MATREDAVPPVQLFHGTIIHSTADSDAEIHQDSVLLVERGHVTSLAPEHQLADLLQRTGASSEDVTRLSRHQLLLPGLVDAHVHASQYPNAGLALDMPLLEWLDNYTFPMESRFQEESFARQVYSTVVGRTLRNGTTCASYFATIHRPACELLVDICRDAGQRALVGKVNMDRNAPEYYCETTDQSLQETAAFVDTVLSGADGRSGLVQPTITPRFAISCSDRLLQGLGQLAQQRHLHVQTHCGECLPEVAFVQKLFPQSAHYVDVYRQAGLLGPRTVLAHCVHVKDEELDALRETGTGAAHCPLSNINLRSGLCDVLRLQRGGVNVGIGTDVSGGHDPSILSNVRSALQTSNIHNINRSDYTQFDFRHAFKLATLGGAAALGLADCTGNFEPGKQLDALLVSMGEGRSQVDILTPLSTDELLQKFVYLADSRDIQSVYVAGREVVSNQDRAL